MCQTRAFPDCIKTIGRFPLQHRSLACRHAHMVAAKHEAAAAAERISALEAALERRTGAWEAAEAAKQALLRSAGLKVEQAAKHAVERLRLQVRTPGAEHSMYGIQMCCSSCRVLLV